MHLSQVQGTWVICNFFYPLGVAISPTSKNIVVADLDLDNHHVQILNPDLTVNSSIGSKDNGSESTVPSSLIPIG